MSRSLIVFSLFAAACAHRAPEPASREAPIHRISITHGDARAEPLSPREMLDWMGKSEVQYEVISPPEDMQVSRFAAQLWPAADEPIAMPYARATAGGQYSLAQYPIDEASLAALDDAEPAFEAKRYEEAAKAYEATINRWPNQYLAWTYWGETAYFRGDFKTAIERYSKAIELNPYDHIAYYFHADAYVATGRLDDAKSDFASALALRPRYESIQNRIEDDPTLDFTIVPPLVQPKALVCEEEGSIKIFVSPKNPEWLPFGVCKALWFADPKFRAKMTGSEERSLSNVEEIDCLAYAAAFYGGLRKKGETPQDLQLERLVAALKEGWGDEVFLYEIASRVFPHVMVTIPPEERERVRQYVLKFVLTPRGAPAKPAPVRGGDDGS